MGDAELASEAVDEAFTRAYARWSRVSQYQDPVAWLYRVAANWATSWLRKRRLRPIRPADQLDHPVEDLTSDHDLAWAVAELAPKHRAVVVLRFYLDWDVARIATALDVPRGTVKSRLHRAIEQLRGKQEVHP